MSSLAGVDSPRRPFIALLNYLRGYGLGWKLRGEQALRDSGVAYVVVRPVGLKDTKEGEEEVPPLIKQCVPYEVPRLVFPFSHTDLRVLFTMLHGRSSQWGMCMISRRVVGAVLVHALLEDECENRTINCREDPALSKQQKKEGLMKDYDWEKALTGLRPDAPIPATFEDHVAGVKEVKQKVQLWAGVAAAAAVVGGLVLYARL